MNCPKCRERTEVINTWQTEGKVRRRRECHACGLRFSTVESHSINSYAFEESKDGPFKPGQKVPASGLYEVRGPRGGMGGKKGRPAERALNKGDVFPPTAKRGSTYRLVRHIRPGSIRNG